MTSRLLLVCGLRSEADIAPVTGAEIILSGGDPAKLQMRLATLSYEPNVVISFGLAAGLVPGLTAGDVVIADKIVTGAEVYSADASMTARLAASLPNARIGAIAGVESVIADAEAKTALAQTTGAIAADMESAAAADYAQRCGKLFIAIRAVSDDHSTALPPFVRRAITPNGDIDTPAVIKALVAAPAQIAALPSLALGSRKAHAALRKAMPKVMEVLGAGS